SSSANNAFCLPAGSLRGPASSTASNGPRIEKSSVSPPYGIIAVTVWEALACFLAPKVGIEPTLPGGNRILSPARLPVPPLRRPSGIVAPRGVGLFPPHAVESRGPVAAEASAPTLIARLPRPSVVGVLGMLVVLAAGLLLLKNLTVAPSRFFEVTLIGITTGCVYALVALGYTLVYGILELINFAHGDVFMLGGMFTITYATHLFGFRQGQGAVSVLIVLATLVLTMLTCGLLNSTIEFVAYRPLRHAPRLAPLITAIGVSFILQNVGLRWKGPNYIAAHAGFPDSTVISFHGV